MSLSNTAHSIISYLSQLDGFTAYAAILGLLLACGLGVPMPEDITLIASGVIAGLGSISLTGAMFAGFFGVMLGDAIMFSVGRAYGRKAFELPVIRTILTPNRIAMAERQVLRNSKFICFTARFLPGLRSPIFLTAGSLGVKPMTFYMLDGFAALISVPVWVYGGYWFGQNIEDAIKFAERMQVSLIGVIFIFVGLYFWIKYYRKIRRARQITNTQENSP